MAQKRMTAYCFREKCSYRRDHKDGASFCMFPQCPYGESHDGAGRGNKLTLKEIVENSRKRGLMP